MTNIPDNLSVGSGLTPDIILSQNSGSNTVFNQNKLNIDFVVLATGNSSLNYDASTGRLGIGTGLPDAALHVVAPCAKDGLILESITNCPTGVSLLLVHNPQTSPQSNSYPAIINLAGRDDNYNEIYYAQIMSKVLDPTTGSTSGELIFTVDDKGVNKPVFLANTQNSVLGANNSISGHRYNVDGSSNIISGIVLNILGSNNSGSISSGIIVGNTNIVKGSKIYLISNNSNISGINSVSFGDSLYSSGNSNILAGSNSYLSGYNNIILGASNNLKSNYTVSLAQQLSCSGISGIILGSNIGSTGNYNIFIGNSNYLYGDSNSIVGSTVSLTGNNNLVYGSNNNVSGNNLISIGSSQNIYNINSGIFVGNSIGSSDANRSIIVGLNNQSLSNQGLSESILIGINNNMFDGNPNKLLLVGQNNLINDINGSVIVGSSNNLSGVVNNNVVLGGSNASASTSNNNVIIGVLNNQTGIYINSVGSISGTASRVNGTFNNSVLAGINNVIRAGNLDNIIGNKNSVSGSNDSVIGSFNNLRNSSNSYAIGNSNYIVGDKAGVFGNKNIVIGQESIVFNNANSRMETYGSGNIVLGYNQIVSSGLVVGTNNKTHGLNNIVYGRNNTIGSIRHQFTSPSTTTFSITIPSLNVANKYAVGDTVLLTTTSPAALANTFIREINDIVEDSVQNTTTLQFSTSVAFDTSNGYYSINEFFDDANTPNAIISGLVMPYQVGGGIGGPELNPTYGSNNIVLGSNNNYIYSSGVVIGYNNNVSGVKNVVIGYGISGTADNTLYLGTNDSNKIILDNYKIVFNSGKLQDNFIIKSSDNNSSIVNIDLNNNLFGINTNNPSANLSVSGLLSTDTIRINLSAPDQYVLTSNTNGYGTWQLPVRLSGTNNGLVYRVNDKVGSGISNIIFNPSTNSLNFNLGNNNGFYITSSGLYVNDDGDIYGMRIRGSGGSDFARVLFNTNFANHRIDFFNISGNSGTLNNLNVSSGLTMPSNLTGTFLYVGSTGNRLSSFTARPYSILFANNNSWSTGDASLRWFYPQNTLGIGATGTVNSDTLLTNNISNPYNILLSSNSNIDTVFNNLGYGNRFSVLNSGAQNSRVGMHINPVSGQVAINSTGTHQAHLYVEGTTWTKSLRLGQGSTASGLYLRVDSSGNVSTSVLDLTTQFSGVYPLKSETTSLGQTNAFRVDLSFRDTDRNGNVLGASGNGQFLIYDGSQWNINKGLRIPQDPWVSNNDRTLKGIQFGHKTKINHTYHTHAFGAGSFLHDQDIYDGSSQFAQYYLRCRTPMTGGNVVALTTNFAKDGATTENQYNTISLGNINGYNYDNIWTYNIFVSVLWQDGTSIADPAQGSRYAAGMTIEGSIFRSADGSVFTKLGQEKINIYSTGVGVVGLPAGMGIATYVDTDAQTTIPRLSIRATGITGKTALWNATAQIHQLNHPGSYPLYGSS